MFHLDVYKIKQILPDKDIYQCNKKLLILVIILLLLRVSVAAAVAIIEVNSRGLPGFFTTLVANFLPASTEILPKGLQKLPSPSAFR